MTGDVQHGPAADCDVRGFVVGGMTCGICCDRVQRALRRQIGVQDAKA